MSAPEPLPHEAAFLGGDDAALSKALLPVFSERSLSPLVARLGPALTSADDAALRSRAVRLLGEAVRRLPTLEAGNETLAEFVAARLRSDRDAHPALLFAARHLAATRGAPGDAWVAGMARAVFEAVEVPALAQAARRDALGLLMAAAPGAAGEWFVRGVVEAVDGEKDPRNLVACFSLAAHCLRRMRADLTEELLEELFDVTSCYFPITFAAPPAAGANAPVSGEDLRLALRAVFASHEGLARLVVPLLVEKAGASQETAREDALATLAACARAYGGETLRAVGLRPLLPALMSDARPLRAVAEAAGSAFVAPVVERCLAEALGAEPGAVSARQHGALLARGLPPGTLPASAWAAWRSRAARAADGSDERRQLVQLAAALLAAHGPPASEAGALASALEAVGGDTPEAAACMLRVRPGDAAALRAAARHPSLDDELAARASARDVLDARLDEADLRRVAGRWPAVLDAALPLLSEAELVAALGRQPVGGGASDALVELAVSGQCPAAAAALVAARVTDPAQEARLAAWALDGGDAARLAVVAALRPAALAGADHGALIASLAGRGEEGVAAAAAVTNKAPQVTDEARRLAAEHPLVLKALVMRGAAGADGPEAAACLGAPADFAAVVDPAREWPHAARAPLYAQRFFAVALPGLLDAGRLAEAGAMMQHLPSAALRPHLAQAVVPAVMAGSGDAVGALERLLAESPGTGLELGDDVGPLVSRLLALACDGEAARDRGTALRCLGLLAGPAAGVPYHRLHPLRGRAVRRLAAALDDPSREVRRQAVRCRNAWFAAASK